MDADGLHQRRLAFIQGEAGLPAWSPDGRRIAYVSDVDGSSEIYLMGIDGKNQRRIAGTTREATPSRRGRRTGSGSRSSAVAPGATEVYVMRADGSHVRRLTRG